MAEIEIKFAGSGSSIGASVGGSLGDAGVVLTILRTVVSWSVRPSLSVIVRVILKVPSLLYLWMALAPVSELPSPKSH
jgi:hypothetical protein